MKSLFLALAIVGSTCQSQPAKTSAGNEETTPAAATETAAPSAESPAPADEATQAAPTRAQPSDDELKRDIEEALVRDPLTAGADIHVDVAASLVTLTGTVRSLAQAQAAEDIARRVHGTGQVYDQLDIVPPNSVEKTLRTEPE